MSEIWASCSSCRFFCRDEDEDSPLGDCRAHGPSIFPFETDGKIVPKSGWPTVEDVDWCGEYRAHKVVEQKLKVVKFR